MNIGDLFFITYLKMKIERKLEKYNPNLVTHLSKQGYDVYLIRSKIYNEVLKVLDDNDITIEKIKEFLKEKIKQINELLKNTKNEKDIIKYNLIIEEYENLIKLTGDFLGYK